MKTLGVYGPDLSEAKETAVANYIANSLPDLSRYFKCVLVSRYTRAEPFDFDHVLYHISASKHTYHAHTALRQRPGPAIIHEHNCLQLYCALWDKLPEDIRKRILALFSQKFGRSVRDLAEAQALADELPDADRYSVDIGAEAIFMDHTTAALTHSPFTRDLLQKRYPQTRVEWVPFIVDPFTANQAKWAREEIGLQADDFLFGTFGLIGEYKRVEQIISAWQRWRNRPPTAKLLILGPRQYDIDIPLSNDLLYREYVSDERKFDAFVAATDCGIQLRHPTLGETSSVISKMVANGKRMILSATPYTTPYERHENVIRIRPDAEEIPNLIKAFQRVIQLPRLPLRYDPAHSPDACIKRWTEIILSPGVTVNRPC